VGGEGRTGDSVAQDPRTGELAREDARFRPWPLLDRLDDLRHLGGRLGRDGTPGTRVSYRELAGPGALRYLVRADDARTLTSAVCIRR
jgi:DNA polymerase I